jgi:hypothetical protein
MERIANPLHFYFIIILPKPSNRKAFSFTASVPDNLKIHSGAMSVQSEMSYWRLLCLPFILVHISLRWRGAMDYHYD